jgi:hypothetical protein
MTFREMNVAKYFKIGPYGIVASIIIVLSLLFRVIMVALHYPEANSDEGSMGIEALHIAFQGQHPIYLYGQDYMGVLEAYIAAPFFHLFGVSVFTLRIGMLIMYTLFMIAIYWLSSLFYSKRLALLTLALLSLGTADMLIQQLRAVGGAIETILFGTLMFVLAYHLSSSAQYTTKKRYLLYAAWGCTVGLALWIHILVLPFVLSSGLFILIFCWHDWRTLAIPCLLLGLLLGGIPLLHGLQAFSVALHLQSGTTISNQIDQANSVQKQILSTVLWGIPLATGVQPICAVSDLPYYGSGTALTLPCSLLQGAWSASYLLLLASGLVLAAAGSWKLWQRQRREQRTLSIEEQHEAVLHIGRMMLLLTAVMIILLYVSSPLSGLKPWSTRYLVGLLVATPAILWPLWKRSGLEHLHLSHKQVSNWISSIILVMTILVVLAGTIYTVTTIPTAYADAQQQQQLVNDLLQLKVTRVYLEYWTCYRLLFQSQEKILCARPPYPAVTGGDRYTPDARIVDADPDAAYMFPINEPNEIRAFEQYNTDHHKRFQKHILDGMALYIPVTSN